MSARVLATLPNGLSALRLILGVVIFGCVRNGAYVPAALLYMVACTTDWLDGLMARRLGCVSRFGACLDPVADKVLTFCAYLAMYAEAPWLFWLVVARDIAIMAGTAWVLAKRWQVQISPLLVSKLNTVFLLMLPYVWMLQKIFAWSFLLLLITALTWLIVITTIASSAGYACVLCRIVCKQRGVDGCSQP